MKLLPHQIDDAAFLAAKPFAGCFSGMGSGKTLTALEAARLVACSRVLVIAPPIALRMWAGEGGRHLGMVPAILKSGKTVIGDASMAVCSYQIATARSNELRDWIADGVVICDESHALKDIKAKRTQAVLGRGGIVSKAKHAWMLTGTPSTRWNDDYYPFLCRADLAGLKERCGGTTLQRFQRQFTVRQLKQYAHMRQPVWVTVGNRRSGELGEWIYRDGLAVRRELADVWAQMPPLTKSRYTIDLDYTVMAAEERKAVRDSNKLTMQQIEKMQARKDPALATIRRCIGMGKVQAAVEELRDRLVGGQRPILVGAWHTDVIDALRLELAELVSRADMDRPIAVAKLDGRTGAAQRAMLEAAFNRGMIDVLIGQIAAMGVSLNLQRGGAHYIVVVEEDWSPAIMDQFYARLHRIGQQHHVQVDTLVADLKIEQAVERISAAKAAGHRAVNNAANEETDDV